MQQPGESPRHNSVLCCPDDGYPGARTLPGQRCLADIDELGRRPAPRGYFRLYRGPISVRVTERVDFSDPDYLTNPTWIGDDKAGRIPGDRLGSSVLELAPLVRSSELWPRRRLGISSGCRSIGGTYAGAGMTPRA